MLYDAIFGSSADGGERIRAGLLQCKERLAATAFRQLLCRVFSGNADQGGEAEGDDDRSEGSESRGEESRSDEDSERSEDDSDENSESSEGDSREGAFSRVEEREIAGSGTGSAGGGCGTPAGP